ncbi:MAG: hypothetical protein ACHQEM_00040 [Chitinophagales bacterium]
MKPPTLHILFILAMMMVAPGASAQEGITTKASVDRNSILIGEPIQFSLEVHAPLGTEFNWFRLDSIPHFEIIDKGNLDSVVSGEQKIFHQKLVITSFDSGSLHIPQLMLEAGGRKQATDSIAVEVGYSSFDPKKDYHDIKDIINIENPYVKYLIWIISGMSLFSIAASVYFLRKSVPITQAKAEILSKLSPYDEAMKSLEVLKMENLPEQGQVKLYYTRLNDILRLFVLRKLQMSSLEKTNEEIIIQLRQLNISQNKFYQLSSALRMSDFVKFAKYLPDRISNEQNFDIIESSVNLLNKIEH